MKLLLSILGLAACFFVGAAATFVFIARYGDAIDRGFCRLVDFCRKTPKAPASNGETK